mgnify:CR=1 FL=1
MESEKTKQISNISGIITSRRQKRNRKYWQKHIKKTDASHSKTAFSFPAVEINRIS